MAATKEQERLRYAKKRKIDPRHRSQILISSARKRAKQKDLPCDIDADWIHERLLAGKCEVTGIPFKFDYPYSKTGQGQQRAFSPSLDRTDSSLGYTKENTKVVVWVYNGAKGVGTHEEVMALAEALCRK